MFLDIGRDDNSMFDAVFVGGSDGLGFTKCRDDRRYRTRSLDVFPKAPSA
jgi:hypothetical protein